MVDVLYQRHDFDLDMDLLNPRIVHEMGSKIAHIIGSEKIGDHVVSIELTDNDNFIPYSLMHCQFPMCTSVMKPFGLVREDTCNRNKSV